VIDRAATIKKEIFHHSAAKPQPNPGVFLAKTQRPQSSETV